MQSYIKRNKMYENLIAYRFRDKAECNRNYVFQFLSRTQQIFEYTGLPETMPAEYLELYLQYNGFACIAEYKNNLYAFFGGLGGEPDAYYQPTICTVNNPALGFDKTLNIGQDCIVIRNDLFYMGLLPIINRYATALVENDITMDMCGKNMRSVALISAPSDSVKKAADIFIQGVENGELSAVGDNAFLEGIKVFPMSGNASSRITDLIEYHQYLKAGLFNEIGLDANYNMKRERLSNGETELNQDSLVPLIQQMLDCRKRGVEQVNTMFGANITVELSPLWKSVQAESETPNTEPEPETETEVNADETDRNPNTE